MGRVVSADEGSTNWIVVAIACCLAITGFACNAGAFASPIPEPEVPLEWGPDTFVDVSLLPASLPGVHDDDPMPTWQEFADREATGIFNPNKEHFAWRRMSNWSDERFIKVCHLINPDINAMHGKRAAFQAQQDPILDSAEALMAIKKETMHYDAPAWLHIAPLYAPRPQYPRNENGSPKGEGKLWLMTEVAWGGWHGYILWDSIYFPEIDELLTQSKALRNVAILSAHEEL